MKQELVQILINDEYRQDVGRHSRYNGVSPERLQQFMEAYVPALYDAVEKYPTEYAYSPELVPSTANKMRAAIIKGSYNKDGRAFKAVCKKLGIPFTYKALNEWLRESTS